MNHLTLILGGSCSGKSRYALEYGQQFGPRRYLVATAQALQEDMVTRIEAQKRERSAEWIVIEEAIKVPDIVGFLQRKADVVVIDCLFLWLSNLMMVQDPNTIEKEIAKLMTAIKRIDCAVITVSNEIGCGIIPPDPISRGFRDLLGRMHQNLASLSNEVVFMIAGIPMTLTPRK